jgi:hypothetical protein
LRKYDSGKGSNHSIPSRGALLMDKIKSRLITLCAAMARRDGIPSPYIDDHDCFLPKSMSQKQRNYFIKQLEDTDSKIRQWSGDLSNIIHEMKG